MQYTVKEAHEGFYQITKRLEYLGERVDSIYSGDDDDSFVVWLIDLHTNKVRKQVLNGEEPLYESEDPEVE